MKTLPRLLAHLRTTSATGRRAFPPDTLHAIEQAIADGETRHRAEVRLIVEASLPLAEVWAGTAPRARARELFAHYRVWDTEENCGVLVYINLADHKVEIVADRGVGKVVAAADWQAICRTMTQGFAQGRYHESVLTALEQLNALLARHYPDNGAPNQLPNKPVLL